MATMTEQQVTKAQAYRQEWTDHLTKWADQWRTRSNMAAVVARYDAAVARLAASEDWDTFWACHNRIAPKVASARVADGKRKDRYTFPGERELDALLIG